MDFETAMKTPVQRKVVSMDAPTRKKELQGYYDEPGVVGGIASVLCEGLELYLFPITSDDDAYGVLWMQAGPDQKHKAVVVFTHEWPTLAYKAALHEMTDLGLGSAFAIHDDYRIEDDEDRDKAYEAILSSTPVIEEVGK